MSTEKDRLKELEEQLKIAMNTIAEKEEQLKNAKIKKEDSEIFFNKRLNSVMKFSSLSETKRYFETNHLSYCKKLIEKNNNNLLDSDTFHKLLSEDLNL